MDASDRFTQIQPVPTMPCGRCGEPNVPDAVTCQACGGLLAAYQAPAGAGSSASSATVTPSPAITVPSPSAPSTALPVHRPRSLSPIGDALRRPAPEPAAGNQPVVPDGNGDVPASTISGRAALYRPVDIERARVRVSPLASRPVVEAEPAAALEMPGLPRRRVGPPEPLQAPALPRSLSSDRSISLPDASADWILSSPNALPVRLSGSPAGMAWLLSALLLVVIRWVVGLGRSEPQVAIVAGLILSILVIWWVSTVTFARSVPVIVPAPYTRRQIEPARPLPDPAYLREVSPERSSGSSAGVDLLVGVLLFGVIAWLMWQGRSVPRGTAYLGVFLSAIVVWWLSHRFFFSGKGPPGPEDDD